MEGLTVLVERDFDAAAKADVMLRAKSDRDNRVADELAEAEAALRRLRVVADQEARRERSHPPKHSVNESRHSPSLSCPWATPFALTGERGLPTAVSRLRLGVGGGPR